MPDAPRTANLATSPDPVLWSDGSLYNGYVWFGLTLPSGYTTPYLYNSAKSQAIPRYGKIPVTGGVIDSSTKLFWNADIVPPGSTYRFYWFDDNDSLIAPSSGTAGAFTVDAATETITAPTLTVPSSSSVPVPQS